ETQTWSELTFEEQLDGGYALDGGRLSRPKVKIDNAGKSVTNQVIDTDNFHYGESDVDIARDVDDPFWDQRALRIRKQGEVYSALADVYGGGSVYAYNPRPYTLLWIYNGEESTDLTIFAPFPL